MSTKPNDLLSQDELDALLQNVNENGMHEDPPAAVDEARDYDLASRDRIVRGRLPTLEMINERFARHWRIGLFNMLRRSAEIKVKGVEMVKFSEYLHSLHVPSNLNLIRMKPLKGTALLVMEPRLVFSVVDNYFGGDGRFPSKIEGREFTLTEVRVIQLLLKQTFHDLAEAWLALMKVEFEYVSSEINPLFANVVGPREYVAVSRFSIELDGGAGEMHVVLPYSMLEPIRDLLDAGLQSDRAERDDSWTVQLRQQIEESEVAVSSQLCEVSVSLRQLAGFKVGDIVPIELPKRISLCVEGVPVFEGEFGVANGRNAVQISRIIKPKIKYISKSNPMERLA
jgi:flagellar motor switch protein FliM